MKQSLMKSLFRTPSLFLRFRQRALSKSLSTRVINQPIRQKSPLLVLAKRLQHLSATYHLIVRRNMLRTFGHRIATHFDMLGVVGSSLKMVQFPMQHLWMLHDVLRCTRLAGHVQHCCARACALFRFGTPNILQ